MLVNPPRLITQSTTELMYIVINSLERQDRTLATDIKEEAKAKSKRSSAKR